MLFDLTHFISVSEDIRSMGLHEFVMGHPQLLNDAVCGDPA